jgi:hypothetical protein
LGRRVGLGTFLLQQIEKMLARGMLCVYEQDERAVP